MSKRPNTYILLMVLALTMVFSACGDSGSTDTPKGPDMSVAAMEDLPNCTENREGVTALVAEDNSTYECKSGKWTFVSAPMQTVETLDDLSNCTSKAEGDTVKVASESAIFRCDDGKWEKYRALTDTLESVDDLLACVAKREGNTSYITREHALYRCVDGSWEKMVAFMDTVKTKDDLPNCTGKKEGDSTFVSKEESVYLCIDKEWAYLGEVTGESDDLPNCTEKREGYKAFVTTEYVALKCSDGKWLPYDIYQETEEKNSTESSNSSEESSSSQEIEYSSGISNKSSSSKKTEFSSSSRPVVVIGNLTDERDGRAYKTVVVGKQTWMAENLNYDDGYGLCPMQLDSNCEKYGRLYNSRYSNVRTICPDGWHLPDGGEWNELISYVSKNNGGEPVGVSLKATTGWYTKGEAVFVPGGGSGSDDSIRVAATQGSDLFGFSAMPAGSCWENSECYVGDDTRFHVWENAHAYKLAFDKDALIAESECYGAYISIRCVQNDFPIDEFDSLTDARDGQIYKIVKIGNQWWMATNLNFEVDSSFCSNDSAEYCEKSGRLYRWAAAIGKSESECGYGSTTCTLPSGNIQGVCPAGLHLPSKAELETLTSTINGLSSAGKNHVLVDVLNYSSAFWSSTEAENMLNAFYMYYKRGDGLYYNDKAELGNSKKSDKLTVRCLKD